MIKRGLAAAGLVLAGLFTAPTANADYVGDGCVADFWMYGLRGSTRIICDSERAADGSWLRRRGFFADSYYRSFCGTYWCEGRVIPPLERIDPPYTVTDATIPSGEPGWIPSPEGKRIIA